MPPDAFPPDRARGDDAHDATVVDPGVLAERRAQRAEQSERTAVRRAADAQTLAADLARERARLEAERDAARAEAAAAREGADAVKAEARHLQAERDTLRAEVEQLRAGRGDAPAPAVANGGGAPHPAVTVRDLRRELAVARGAVARTVALAAAPPAPAAVPPAALARERALLAQRAAEPPGGGPRPPRSPVAPGERATPATELALERERSGRLQALVERSAAVERDLRAQVEELERGVRERREAERRIEAALRRVREEFDADAPERVEPPPAAVEPPPAAAAMSQAAAPAALSSPLDALRLDAARERLRAEAPPDEEAPPAQPPTVAFPAPVPPRAAVPLLTAAPQAPPAGPPAPWLPAALDALVRADPATAGRLVLALLPAQGLVTERPLRYDVVLAGGGSVAVDVGEHGTRVVRREQPRGRRETDFRLLADEAGLARHVLGRRGLRRRARVRGSRRRARELRRLAREPLALRDLAAAGAAPAAALTLRLAALAIAPAATAGHRFTIAHAALAGGPADAWLQIRDGEPPAVLHATPGNAPATTIRATRGALLATLAGVEPGPGETALLDGEAEPLALVRAWIAATEFPGAG